MSTISVSVLTADFTRFYRTLELLERHPVVGYVHLDVMDGAFVPNISFGAPVVQSFAGKTKIPFDIHLMVQDPERFLPDYMTVNSEYIVVHIEATKEPEKAFEKIRELGAKPGISINPETDVRAVLPFLADAEQVLVMSVHPGFAGQKFIPSALEKIAFFAEQRAQLGLSYKIAVDGGINAENIASVAGAGADIIVAGSSVLNAEDPDAALEKFAEILGA